MKSGLLALILLIAVVVLVIQKGDAGGSESSDAQHVPPSQRGMRVSFSPSSARAFLIDFSNRESAGGNDFERLRSAIREFSEEELLEMVRADQASMEVSDCWRRAAIWERLGELESDAGFEILSSYHTDGNPNSLNFREHAAHAFVGGWVSTMTSFDEVQGKLFPRFGELRQLGYREFERAVGREVARFDPDRIWPHYSSKSNPAHDFTMAGSDKFLTGYLQALSGNPKAGELIPMIQLRTRLSGLNSSIPDGVTVKVVDASTSVDFHELEFDAIDLEREQILKFVEPSPITISTENVVVFQSPDQLLSQGFASLALHDPTEARKWNYDLFSGDAQLHLVNLGGVWNKAASQDFDRVMGFLKDPEHSDDHWAISQSLAKAAPEKISEIVAAQSSPDFEAKVLETAITNVRERQLSDFFPSDYLSPAFADLSQRAKAIESAIKTSSLDSARQEQLRIKLDTQMKK